MSLRVLARLMVDRGDLDTAATLFGQVLETTERLVRADTSDQTRYHFELAISLRDVATTAFARSHFDVAEPALQRSIWLFNHLPNDPPDSIAARYVAEAYRHLAAINQATDRLPSATRLQRHAATIYREAFDWRTDAELAGELATVLGGLADLHRLAGDLTEAEAAERERLGILLGSSAAASGSNVRRENIAIALTRLADILAEQRDDGRADALYRAADEARRSSDVDTLALAALTSTLNVGERASEARPARTLVELPGLLGLRQIDDWRPAQYWAPRPMKDHLRIPIGRGLNGADVALDLKESAAGGDGPHGLLVGATGSGKTVLLRSLALMLTLTHSPDDVNLYLFDTKGGATFDDLERLPHVAALVRDTSDWHATSARVKKSLAGELRRRQRLLRDADFGSVRDYRRARDVGAPLAPLPSLVVMIDEFAELVSAEPDFLDTLATIGRTGRSLGVHMLLASQRVDERTLRGVDVYLSFRIGLRTFSASESRLVLGNEIAYQLPANPGAGYLMTAATGSRAVPFQAAYAGVAVSASDGPGQPTGDNGPGQPTSDDVVDLVCRLGGDAETSHLPARTIWLPPLADVLTLDQALGEGSLTPEVGLQPALPAEGMWVPLGTLDDPEGQEQTPWLLDLTANGGHAAVVGAPQSGKTTWLRTLVAGLALTHTPAQVAIYGLDLAGSGLVPLRDFPQVGGIATRFDRERLGRTLDELLRMLAEREALFRDHGLDSISDLRRQQAVGDLLEAFSADIVLVVDDAGALRTEFDDLDERFGELLRRGSSLGLHVIVSLVRWNDLRMALHADIGTRIELRLNDPFDSLIDRQLAAMLRSSPPGRALTDAKLFAQTALPRVDGAADPDSVTGALVELAQAMSSQWAGRRAPTVRVLPAVVEPGALPDAVDDPTGVPFGISESTFAPVTLDLLGRDPHLLVLGDAGSGKTSLLRRIVRGLAARYTENEIVLAIYDPRRGLTNLAPNGYIAGYASSSNRAARLSAAVCTELQKRMPEDGTEPNATYDGSAREEPHIVLVVDDYDVLTAARQSPLTSFLPFLPSARHIGLHVVLARTVAGASSGMWDPVVALVRDTGATGLLLSGDRSEGQLFPGTYPRPAPPGRGYFLRRGAPREVVQIVHEDPPS